jgi:hypothetical protein|nr:MAG TPA: tail protein [Bacteriophage sp.]
MAMGIWLPGGGGADLDAVTASAGDVLAGKVIVGPDGEPLTGTLALSGNASDGQVLSGQTYYDTDAKTKRTGTMPNRGTVNQSLAINGSYTIPEGYHNGNGKVTQSVKTKGAQTFTPGRSNQSISANQWLSGAQTIMGDPNLKPENIKKGVTIFGNKGTHEGYVTSPLNIFNKGTWGGGVSGYSALNVGNGGIHLNSEANLQLTTGRKNSAIPRTANLRLNAAINISAYSYLKVDFTIESSTPFTLPTCSVGISTNPGLMLSASDPLSKVSGIAAYSSANNNGTLILDISKLSGNYFIYLENYTTDAYAASFYVTRVYLSSN